MAMPSSQAMVATRFDCRGAKPILLAAGGFKLNRKLSEGVKNPQESLRLILDRLKTKVHDADAATYARLLRACGKFQALPEGKRVHSYIRESGLEIDRLLGNHLVEMYLKCGSLRDAQRIFDEMDERDTILWTSMISVYSERGHHKAALKLFQKMQAQNVTPDSVTFVTVLNACARIGDLGQGRAIHSRIRENGHLEGDVILATCLLNMYSKCGSLEEARETFDKIQKPDVITWNSMLSAYVQNGAHKEALEFYEQMPLEPNTSTFVTVLTACSEAGDLGAGTKIKSAIAEKGLEGEPAISKALFNMYGKLGDLENAGLVFEGLLQRDAVSWAYMISFYVRHNRSSDGLKLFKRMLLEGVRVDKFGFTTSLSACDGSGSLADGRRIHACIKDSGFESDVVVRSALIHMYGRSGSLDDATKLYQTTDRKNVLLSSAMIAAYAKHQHWQQVLQLSRDLQLMPYKLTIVDILTACSELRAVDDGKAVHEKIREKGLDSDPTVAGALFSMYCKCGAVEDAHIIFTSTVKDDPSLWNPMIKAYIQAGQPDMALQVYKQMQLENVSPDQQTRLSILSITNDKQEMEDRCKTEFCEQGNELVIAKTAV